MSDEQKNKPIVSGNISIAKWPDGWSVGGYITDDNKPGYVKCKTATEVPAAVDFVTNGLLTELQRIHTAKQAG